MIFVLILFGVFVTTTATTCDKPVLWYEIFSDPQVNKYDEISTDGDICFEYYSIHTNLTGKDKKLYRKTPVEAPCRLM